MYLFYWLEFLLLNSYIEAGIVGIVLMILLPTPLFRFVHKPSKGLLISLIVSLAAVFLPWLFTDWSNVGMGGTFFFLIDMVFCAIIFGIYVIRSRQLSVKPKTTSH